MSISFDDNDADLSWRKEYLFKVLVLGEISAGKTSFIKRYVHKFFSSQYRATVGVDFALKIIHWNDGQIIRLQLWDIAGQERFSNMTRVYYKEAVGAFIIFDITQKKTLDAVAKWKNDLDLKVSLPDGSNIPTVLLAHKCDLEKNELLSNSFMDSLCEKYKIDGWFFTSAKENINIDESAHFLISKILSIHGKVQENFDKGIINLNTYKNSPSSEKCSC